MNDISYPLAFLAGILSFLSPCVLPLVPSYLSFITGISFEDLTFNGDPDDLLEDLIALDTADIADLRAEMADARDEIQHAIDEIEEARAEVSSVPGGKAVLETALSIASKIASRATREAFEDVRSELDLAEHELADRSEELGPDEVAETQMVIEVIRVELSQVEAALADLLEVMRA